VRRLASRRRAAVGALALVGIALLAVITGLVGGGGEEASQAASTATATTTINRQDLVEVDEEDGTLGYSDERAVVNRLNGTVTWLPTEGAVVKPDQTLFRVDRTPVILMSGRMPAYRTLSSGVSDGADVKQLEKNLRALGYDEGADMAVDRSWTSATTAAVERWQEAHGFSQTGEIELGRIVFQPGKRRVASVDATLGGDAGSSSAGGTGASTSTTTGASYGGTGVMMSIASVETTPTETTPTETTPTETTPQGEQQKKKKKKKQQKKQKKQKQQKQQQSSTGSATTAAPSGGGSAGATTAQGSSAQSTDAQASSPASTLLTTTSTRSQVEVDLDTSKASLAKKGVKVTVALPSGDSVRGRIASVGKVATAPESTDSATSSSTDTATIPVKINIAGATALDQAPATVRFESSRRKNVLAIPVTALLARSGGRFAVEVRSGGTRRLVAVTPGLYTSGYVEISGPGLKPGIKVTDARV
jgi:Putative peptidoglycan binding domain